MAKIKWSALVSDVRNSLNGSTMARNRYGSYMRNKVTPVNPQTSFQMQARQILGNLSSSFRELTLQQINAWNAAAINFPFTDVFGDIKHLSGQTLFVKLNANLEKIGKPRISNPPLSQGFPELAIEDFTAELTAGELSTLEIAINQAVVPAGYTLVVYATPSVSKSISFVKNRYRMLTQPAEAVAGVVDIKDSYVNRFGQPIEDEVIHVRVALISNTSGQQGVPLTAQSSVLMP